MSHHCFLLHISRMKADRNIISSVPGPLDMSSPWAMSISQTLGGLSEQISPLIAGFCLKWSIFDILHQWRWLRVILDSSSLAEEVDMPHSIGLVSKFGRRIA